MSPEPAPIPYEVRIQRVDATRCLVTFLDAALPATAARRLPPAERLACQAVVYVAEASGELAAEATYQRPPHRLNLPPDEFSRKALALARCFLYA